MVDDLRHRIAVAIHGGKHDPDFMPAGHYFVAADAVIDALGLEQVGWTYIYEDGSAAAVRDMDEGPTEVRNVPIYRLTGALSGSNEPTDG